MARKKKRATTYLVAKVKKLTPVVLKALKKKARKLRMPIVVRVVKKQKGRSRKKLDIVRRAMPPGLRISKKGKVYYETRKNRTDLRRNL